MAYGFLLPVLGGSMQDVTDRKFLREVWSRRMTTQTGSVTVAADLLVNSVVVGVPNDDKYPPMISVGTTTIGWGLTHAYFAATSTADFDLIIYKLI